MKPLNTEEIQTALQDLEGWEFHENAIHTAFEFSNFKEAFAAMVRIAFEAEAMQHHPNWYNVYNRLEISLSTHDANGVTQKDIELAQKIDALIG